MLYRFRKAMQSEEEGLVVNPYPGMPLMPSTCEHLSSAIYARKTLLKEISRKVSRIHDAQLDDATIRSLNDDINRQIRLVHEWDACLIRLGHHERDKRTKWGEESLPEPGNVHGYYYFGRAKTLPGVQELLSPRRAEKTKITPRVEAMMRSADDEYFGVVTPEREAERRKLEREVERKLVMCDMPMLDWIEGIPVHLPPIDSEDLSSVEPINVPTQEQIEQYLIERRKAELLARYANK